MATSTSRRGCQFLRQTTSAFRDLKKLSTVARQAMCDANRPRGGGVIIPIAFATHRCHQSMVAQDFLVIVETVLAAPVGVVNACLGWAS